MDRADIDRRVTSHLTRIAKRDETLETPREMADALGLTSAQMRTSLKRLKDAGVARQVGEAMSGAKTWALTADTRFDR